MFETYLNLGIRHILDWNAIDHILFIVVMICVYRLRDWKKIILIVSAFTIAHTISLALSVYKIVSINSSIVELLIAVTILITCLENIFFKKWIKHRIFLAGFFGIIHGLGFSNYLKSLLSKTDSVLVPLFSFNLGVEIGQLILVAVVLFVLFLLDRISRLNRNSLIVLLSAVSGAYSVYLILMRL
jgi:hypothetical protein